jgi:hypothetical protein
MQNKLDAQDENEKANKSNHLLRENAMRMEVKLKNAGFYNKPDCSIF